MAFLVLLPILLVFFSKKAKAMVCKNAAQKAQLAMSEACRNSSTKDMTLEVKQELLMNNGSGMTKKEFVTYIEVKIGDGGGPDKTALEKLQQGGWTQIQHFKSTGSVESTYSSEEGGSWALSRGGSMESLESL